MRLLSTACLAVYNILVIDKLRRSVTFNTFAYTGWPGSPDTNVQAYCCFVKSFVNLIFYGKCYMHQPFEDFTKIKKKWVHFLFIFWLFWALLV